LLIPYQSANPKGVEYETTFRAERDNSLRKTCGKCAPDAPNAVTRYAR